MKQVGVLGAILLASGICWGQWSSPITVDADTFNNRNPTVLAVDAHSLWAAWLSQGTHSQGSAIEGSFFQETIWTGSVQFSNRLPLVATPPGLAVDPGLHAIWIAYYFGAYPTDEDTWGIYTVLGDNGGIHPPQLTFGDTAVTEIGLQTNGVGRVAAFWSAIEGGGIETYSSVFYSQRQDSIWLPPVRIGAGFPNAVDCFAPGLAGDTADGFYLTYTRNVVTDSAHVVVRRYPDTTTIGYFTGRKSSLVLDRQGRLWLAALAPIGGRECLVVRLYESGVWSPPEVLDTLPSLSETPTLAVDPQGYVWIAHVSLGGIRVRYNYGGFWSESEEIGGAGTPAAPRVVSDGSATIWVLWQGRQGAYTAILSAYRQSHPGIERQTGPTPVRSLLAAPTVSSSGFRVNCAAGAGDGSALDIYDAAGRFVRRLPGSRRSAIWDGTNAQGRPVAPGVYYCCQPTKTGLSRQKLLLVR
jgi:hypothetical protein